MVGNIFPSLLLKIKLLFPLGAGFEIFRGLPPKYEFNMKYYITDNTETK